MYKMVIAEDEAIVRAGLEQVIDWPEYGIEVVASVETGSEALDACLTLRPDILFTDINMPNMSGLDVAKALGDHGLATKVIIISAISDFDFARRAISLSAQGYLLKPVKLNELKKLVVEVTDSLRAEGELASTMNAYEKRIQKSRQTIKEDFVKKLIYGTCSSALDVISEGRFSGIDIQAIDAFRVAVAEVIEGDDSFQVKNDKGLYLFAAMNIIDEILNANALGTVTSVGETGIAVLFYDKATDDTACRLYCGAIKRNLYELLGVKVALGIGTAVDDTGMIPESYECALTALEFKSESNNYVVDYAERLSGKNTFLIGRIKSFIDRHYGEPISLQVIADEVHLTPSYVSQLFKQEVGTNLKTYITNVRIDAAKALLKDSDFKIYEVAEMIGFENPYYFSTVFKKSVGVHPSKYR